MIHVYLNERRSFTLSDFSHIQRIRQEMPATTAHLYFNAGTFGPLPVCALQAMQAHLQREHSDGRIGPAVWETFTMIRDNARAAVARLLNAETGEIALTDNTGEGMNIISYGINWREGDEVITTNHEHHNALGPLYQLRDRFGVIIRFVDLGPAGDWPVLPAVTDLATSRTRLIVLSHVLWPTGAALN